MKERNKRNTVTDGRGAGRGPRTREGGFREGRSGFRKGSPRVKGFRKGAEWKMPALPVLLLAAAVLVVTFVAALWHRSSTPETIQEDEIWSETILGDESSSEGALKESASEGTASSAVAVKGTTSKETAEGWEKIPEDRKAENKFSGESDSDAESVGLPIMTGESAAASKKAGVAASGGAGSAGNVSGAGSGSAAGNTAAAGNGLVAGNTAAAGNGLVAGNASSVENTGGTGNTVASGSTGADSTGVTGGSGSTPGTGTPGTTVQPGENKNPVREPGNVVVEEGGNVSFHQRDSESVELPFDFVDE